VSAWSAQTWFVEEQYEVRQVSDPRLGSSTFLISYRRYAPGADKYGPFHRVRNNRTQTLSTDQKQIDSGMLWGLTPQNGKCPTAQAYFGPLPQGQSGIEFETSVKPEQLNLPNGYGGNWYLDDTAFTGKVTEDNRDYAAITIIVTKHVP
jgi:hypothetical protein